MPEPLTAVTGRMFVFQTSSPALLYFVLTENSVNNAVVTSVCSW